MSDSVLYNLNFERSILSAIIFDPTLFEDIAIKMKPHDFYLPFHQYLFESMAELHEEERPMDEEYLRSRLIKKGKFDEVAMLDLLSVNPISNVEPYLDDLKEFSRRRSLNSLSLEIKKNISEGSESSDGVISMISSRIDGIDDDASDKERHISTIVDSYMDTMNSVADSEEMPWVSTGIKSLDNIIDGFLPGDLVVIGARPSMGKTSLATTFTANLLKKRYGVLFASLEMSTEKITQRLLSIMADEKLSDLKRGIVRNPNKFNSVLSELRASNLVLHGEKNIPFSKLRLKVKRALRKNKGLRFLVIDHIGKLKFNDPRFLRIEIGEVTTELKAIAEEFGVTVILLTQLNREVTSRKNNRPTLSDIRESGDIEQDADIIILPHRESYYHRGVDEREPAVTEADMIVAKNRDGVTGVAKCSFEGEYTRFVDTRAYEVEYEGGSEFDLPRI